MCWSSSALDRHNGKKTRQSWHNVSGGSPPRHSPQRAPPPRPRTASTSSPRSWCTASAIPAWYARSSAPRTSWWIKFFPPIVDLQSIDDVWSIDSAGLCSFSKSAQEGCQRSGCYNRGFLNWSSEFNDQLDRRRILWAVIVCCRNQTVNVNCINFSIICIYPPINKLPS